MERLKVLFDNNASWAKGRRDRDPEYFERLKNGQQPRYLWIGCSDSRIPANEIVGLQPGELFVHRNIANLFIHTDFNSLSVLQYAVEYLGVEHVIVCGHYGCGGIEAAMSNQQLGLVDNWLRHIRDLYNTNKDELDAIVDFSQRRSRLAELNVQQQVLNISHTSVVQNAWQKKRPLYIHGLIYDLGDGYLKDLNCTFSGLEQVEDSYLALSL
jgi:carbonic anhydrase